MAADPREAIAGLRWWHVMEVAPGVVTPGAWDLRPTARPDRSQTFRVAAELLGSRAEHRDQNVYDLDPAEIGEFDVVVMGFVLQMLRDPLRGLEAVRSVCRGHLILLDTVSRPLSLVPSPLARLDARRDGREFFVFNPRGMRKALELAGFHVEAMTRIFRDTYAPPSEPVSLATRLMHRFGVRGFSVAARARRQL